MCSYLAYCQHQPAGQGLSLNMLSKVGHSCSVNREGGKEREREREREGGFAGKEGFDRLREPDHGLLASDRGFGIREKFGMHSEHRRSSIEK